MNTKPILEQHFIEWRKPVKIERLEVGKEYSLSKGDMELFKNNRIDIQLSGRNYLSYYFNGRLSSWEMNSPHQATVDKHRYVYKIENGENNEVE